MNENKQPGINFDAVFLVKEEFNRIPNMPVKVKLNLDMNSNITCDGKKASNELTAVLTGTSEDDIEAFKLTTTFVALFSVLEANENMELQGFMDSNSAALMFPYLREHISEITTKAGVSPVLLAPINIMAMLKKNKKEVTSS